MPLDALIAGDVVLVRSGGRVPADGEIVDGAAELDESMITGESKPVAKDVGDRVVAGTVSTDSAIRVRVDAVGRGHRPGRHPAPGRRGPGVHAPGPRSWPTGPPPCSSTSPPRPPRSPPSCGCRIGDADDAVVRVVTVLVISCPHALGLAIPLTTSLSSAMAARNGILVKDRLALEESRTVDAFLFDKTGTLTKGEHTVVGVLGAGHQRRRGASGSPAPSSPTASIPWPGRSSPPPVPRGAMATASDFRSITGRGVEATVDGDRYAVGGPALLRERSLTEPAELAEWSQGWKDRGAAVLYLVRGDTHRRRRSPSRTRSVPRPAPRSPSSRRWGAGS